MSEKQFEKCSLAEATHVEMGGKMYKFGKEYTSEQEVLKYNDCHIDVCIGTAWQLIHVNAFPLFGIQPLKELKLEPVEFEFIMSLNTLSFFPPLNVPMEAVGKKFKCVEILEEEK